MAGLLAAPGAQAAVSATFQIDMTACSSFATGGSCAGFKPSSFQATWTYDDTPAGTPVTSSPAPGGSGNTVTGSQLKLAATLSNPYPATAGQLASIGLQERMVSSSAVVDMHRTTTPGGAVVSDPYGAYTASFEQHANLPTYANGVSTTYSYFSSLTAWAPLPANLSPVSGAAMQQFLQSAPIWSFNSMTLVSTWSQGVSNTVEVDYYGSARLLSITPLNAVPEPAPLGLMLAGLAVVGGRVRRRGRGC